jgi:histidine ammonia-lyase
MRMNANLSHILGTELLCAAQGNEFRTPLQADKPLQGVIATLREVSPRLEVDRYLAPDLNQAVSLVKSGRIIEAAGQTPLIEIDSV